MRPNYYRQGPSGMAFGPGPMTPAVKMLLWANVGVFVAGTVIPPSATCSSRCSGCARRRW